MQVKNKDYKIRHVPHVPHKIKYIPWMYCRCCGLVYLNNEATRKAIKKGCEVWE
jgi:hypothetical protein